MTSIPSYQYSKLYITTDGQVKEKIGFISRLSPAEVLLLAMATFFLFSTCMYVCMFIATTYSTKLPAETNENVNLNPDWNLAMKRIEDLQRIASIQNNRISTLEKRPIYADVQLLIQLHSTITTQNEQIIQLEGRVRELEAMMRDEDNEPNTPAAGGPLHESNQTDINPKTNLIRQGIFKCY